MAKEFERPKGGSPAGSDHPYSEPGSEGKDALKDQVGNGGIGSHSSEGKE